MLLNSTYVLMLSQQENPGGDAVRISRRLSRGSRRSNGALASRKSRSTENPTLRRQRWRFPACLGLVVYSEAEVGRVPAVRIRRARESFDLGITYPILNAAIEAYCSVPRNLASPHQCPSPLSPLLIIISTPPEISNPS